MDSSRLGGTETSRAPLFIVVPCFNEEAVIMATHSRLVDSLKRIPKLDHELIFVDDGSRDRTFEKLREIQCMDRRVRVVALSRNFGHQVAVTAGPEHATGDAVVLIDADLQDPLEVIEEMVLRWRRSVEVAYGVRGERKGETPFKLWTAKTFYRLITRVSDTPIPLDTGDFRLMDRAVVDALRNMPERDRFIRGMVAWLGFRQETIVYNRAPRAAGETKYSLTKMLRFALDVVRERLGFNTVSRVEHRVDQRVSS
jgi:glycosyltransferase involved in cell wall biosynthesis